MGMKATTNHICESGKFAERRERILSQVDAMLHAEGRPAGSVRLVAVTKTRPRNVVADAIVAGQQDFGENRIAEAESKGWSTEFGHDSSFRRQGGKLHLMGPLQTNKARRAVACFDWIHTLDRPSLAEILSRLQEECGDVRFPRLLVQINVGCESQKSGIIPQDADEFIAACIHDWSLPVVGLMCIPPKEDIPAPHFALLRKIAERHGLRELSMGMSADFSEAIRQGATCIRVGEALFGPREPG